MAYWESTSFKKLQKLWYKKLAQAGFKDIEVHPGHLHTETANFADYEAVQEFYSQISRYQQYGKFENHLEGLVWAMFVDGASLRKIGKAIDASKDTVKRIIDKHKKLMKEAKYE